MKNYATILVLQVMLGLGIIVFSSFPKVRDIERKAHLEQML
jgi:hypothetical protein